jgi:hypothetical protein
MEESACGNEFLQRSARDAVPYAVVAVMFIAVAAAASAMPAVRTDPNGSLRAE